MDNMLRKPSTASNKNGLYTDSDGQLRYYVNGYASYAGLVYVEGSYYYINSSRTGVKNCSYYVTKHNDLLPAGTYNFDANGQMTNPPSTASTYGLERSTEEEKTPLATIVEEYDYTYIGSQLVQMSISTSRNGGTATEEVLNFAYDASGMPATVSYNGVTYYYITNLQGDVLAIVDSHGATLVEYEYDPYGRLRSMSGVMSTTLGEANPLRYRGYVYDSETRFYYLQSRYYDPKIGRFINADSLASTGQGILGFNMFAYCGNDPVNYSDPSGYRRKFWYALFQDHQPGYIHTKVQLHILAVYNAYEALYRKEYVIPGIGRADIVKPSTGEVWEIKHGGSSVDSEINGINNALSQLEKYTGENTGLHPGAAGEFAGIFTINYEKSTYAVIYLTPDAGVILYYLFPIESSAKADYVYSTAPVASTSTPSSSVGLGLLILPMGFSGGCSGGIEPVNKIAYCN